MLPTFSRARNNVARPMTYSNEANLTCKLPMNEAVASYCRETPVRKADVLELMRLAGSDPALAIEILVLANSPASVFCAKIYSLQDAVAVLGAEFTASVMARLASWSAEPQRFDAEVLRRIWSHSLAAAVIGREIAPALSIPKGVGYAVGLTHDVGRLGLLSASPAEYSLMASQSYSAAADALEAERKMLGMDHCKAGHSLAGTWGLPPVFANAAGRHHFEQQADGAETVSLAATACRIAERIGYPEFPAAAETSDDDDPAEGLQRRFNVDLDQLRQEIRQAIWFFESRPPELPQSEQYRDESRRAVSAAWEQPYRA